MYHQATKNINTISILLTIDILLLIFVYLLNCLSVYYDIS